ncbi:MAG: hypothetical protein IIT45_02830, partial [Treponema sp.]|nr:hypothetical protein [Treponema sp.]
MKNSLKEFSFKKMIFQPQFAKKFCCMFFGILGMGFFLSFLIKINWVSDDVAGGRLEVGGYAVEPHAERSVHDDDRNRDRES